MHQIRKRPLPRHIGLILDGNRRYAREQRLGNPVRGHQRGADKLERVLAWLADLQIEITTIYALSTENLQRPPEELEGLLQLIERKLLELAENPAVHARGVRVRVVGHKEMLPDAVRDAIALIEERTDAHQRFTLNIAVGYGGRQEIVDAMRSWLRRGSAEGRTVEELAEELDDDAIARHLYTHDIPDPDLIIRTSGEVRLSGFLLWQSAYSELYFCDTFWPAFRKVDLLRAIRSYQQRQRRMGT
jgi:short-chain Z-isoprenyl diphosphate synthase